MATSKKFPEADNGLNELFIKDPIYQSYDLQNLNLEEVIKRLHQNRSLDAFCQKCKKPSVFRIISKNYRDFLDDIGGYFSKQRVFNISADCTRNDCIVGDNSYCKGRLYFTFVLMDDKLIKFGQFPSQADNDFGTLDIVIKNIDSQLRKELHRAIGLRAYGIGVGSFVYLRRVFEKLIEEAHEKAKDEAGWKEDAYQRVKFWMAERIKLLQNYLPNRLIETSQLYSIVSKGVHELSDDECLEHFDLVKAGIEMILKERQVLIISLFSP